MTESAPTRLNFTSPVNYRILRAILTSKSPFLQTQLATEVAAHVSQVNTITQWLEAHHHLLRHRSDGTYEVTQPAGLVMAMFPYQRIMSHALVRTVKVDKNIDEVIRVLTEQGATLCLESALALYSGYFRPDRVAVYHPKPKDLLAKILPNEGGVLPISVYGIDIPLEGDTLEPDGSIPVRRTSRFRTLIDLVCDNRAYAAKDLFAELWGVIIG